MSAERTKGRSRTLVADRHELDEALQTLDALREGEVDAIVVSGPRGPQVYTLEGPDRPFRAFVESVEQGAISLAADGTVLYCNGFLADLLDTPLERVIGTRLGDYVDAEDESAYEQLTRRSQDEAATAVLRLVASDGERIPARITITPLSGSSPPTWCVIVSELRAQELAREAQHARETAEAANAAKDEFLTLLGHELRTPLNSILGWAQLLLRLAPENPEVRKGLESIERNARTQARLINDLVDTARIASGKLRFDLQPVEIDELVASAVATVLPAAEQKGIRLESDIRSEGAIVLGDPSRLQQIVSNLLSNAVKHTSAGGKIEVSTRRAGSSVEIRVRDDGEGIPADFLPKLFERFQQAGSPLPHGEVGLGIGLAIVKRLAELHGGAVEGFSAGEGKGSVFTVSLPLHVASNEAAVNGDAAAVSKAPELEGRRVLVVEDDAEARDLLMRTFERWGAEVVAATCSKDAIGVLERGPVHLLVSDLALPDRDGYSLIREVRERGLGGEELSALAVSAFVPVEGGERAVSAGFDAYLEKPIDERRLSALVSALS